MTKNYDIIYKGQLRTEMIHLKSGNLVFTDAPTDNNGKGETFSPTDLVAAGLAACMLTVVGIHFNKLGRELDEITCEVAKLMGSNPRRISEVHINFDFGSNQFSAAEMEKVIELALGCPVARSLSSEVKIVTNLGVVHG